MPVATRHERIRFGKLPNQQDMRGCTLPLDFGIRSTSKSEAQDRPDDASKTVHQAAAQWEYLAFSVASATPVDELLQLPTQDRD
jgi:hypothetical protein